MNDQAARLREIIQQKRVFEQGITEKKASANSNPPRIICVTSGKGGVGKTNFTSNLAIALGKQKQRVLIIDADLGLANVDVILGVIPRYSFLDVINGTHTLKDIIVKGPHQVGLITGGSGLLDLVDMPQERIKALISQFNDLNDLADIILIDTGAGLSQSVLSFVMAAQEVIIVCTPEPTAITDAYAMIKTIGLKDKEKRIKILINRVESTNEGKITFEKLQNASKKFLNVDIEKLGYLAEDANVRRSVKLQTPFLLQYPNSPVSKNIELIADKLSHEGSPIAENSIAEKSNFFSRVLSLFR